MIISENSKPNINIFDALMKKTDSFLNDKAKKNENYFKTRKAQLLETDVYETLKECAIGTEFENTIQLVSGLSFPDIIANKYYGVEVKSTEKNHWTSTGSSILESTRDINVERIYMTFGKLGSPVEFKSKPYEQCLYDIAVTHYPRYLIDMNLKPGNTIFDKIGIPYDEFRNLSNQIKPISDYYKKSLKPGQSLWWSSSDPEDDTIPISISLFSSLNTEEKNRFRALLTVFFPSLLGNEKNKYDEPSLWLMRKYGIISTHIRDEFSAGGQVLLPNSSGILLSMPAIFGKINERKNFILNTLNSSTIESLMETWKTKYIENDRFNQWCNLCAKQSISQGLKEKDVLDILKSIFTSKLDQKEAYVAISKK